LAGVEVVGATQLSETSVPMPDPIPLKRRVFTASAWSLGGYGVGMAIRFGSNLIMTRLLVPEMFGVMAIATVVMIGLAMFSDLGLRQNIVQSRRGSDPTFLNTAWTIQILRGFVLWGFALILSLAIALAAHFDLVPASSVYASPSLPYVIAALSFGAAISGLTSTKVSEASRNLALGRITQRDISAQIVGLACMLAWVSIDRSIWALVAGSLAASMFQAAFSHIWLPGTSNRLHWDGHAAVEIFHFGKWIFASSILGFLVNSSDRLLLGWMVDSSTLGLYAIAFFIFSAVEQVVSKVVGGVGFPAFSEVARSGGDLKTAYYRFHVVIASISFLSSGVLMVAGQALVETLYDFRYVQAGWMLQILAVALLMLPFRLSSQCFLALGMSHVIPRIVIVRLISFLTIVPAGFQLFGLVGALWGIVVSQLPSLVVVGWYARRLGLLDFDKEVRVVPMFLVGAGIGFLLTQAVAS
jgi:O-antigen/teichoic acid export membrane protein